MEFLRPTSEFCTCGKCLTSDKIGVWEWSFRRGVESYCCSETLKSKTPIGKRIAACVPTFSNASGSGPICITQNVEFQLLCLDKRVSLLLCFSNVRILQVLTQYGRSRGIVYSRSADSTEEEAKSAENTWVFSKPWLSGLVWGYNHVHRLGCTAILHSARSWHGARAPPSATNEGCRCPRVPLRRFEEHSQILSQNLPRVLLIRHWLNKEIRCVIVIKGKFNYCMCLFVHGSACFFGAGLLASLSIVAWPNAALTQGWPQHGVICAESAMRSRRPWK